MEEKAKAAELIAEAEFLPYKQLAENQGERLRVQEKLAKAKARSQVHKDMGERVTLNQKIMGLEKAKDTRKGQREKDGCSGNYRREKTRSSDVSPDLNRMMCDLLHH